MQPILPTQQPVHNPLKITQNWQIEWMNHYSQIRGEAAKLKKENAGLSTKIEKQNDLRAQMLKKLNEKNERIVKYKTKYRDAKRLLNKWKQRVECCE